MSDFRLADVLTYVTFAGKVESGMPNAAVPVSPITTSPDLKKSLKRGHSHVWVIAVASWSSAGRFPSMFGIATSGIDDVSTSERRRSRSGLM